MKVIAHAYRSKSEVHVAVVRRAAGRAQRADLRPLFASAVFALCLGAGQVAAQSDDAASNPARVTPPQTPSEDGTESAAIKHYARGRALYLEGRYGEALQEVEAALVLDPTSPELHFNVARLHELLGEIDEAIASYARYRALLEGGDPAEIARTDATLKRLRGARFQVQHEPAAAPPEGPLVRTRGVADTAFRTVGGLGLGALLGAVGTGGYALWLDHKHQDYVLGVDGSAASYDRQGERLKRVAFATDGLTIAGGTLTITAILLYVLRTKPLSPSVSPAVTFDARRGQWWVGMRGTL